MSRKSSPTRSGPVPPDNRSPSACSKRSANISENNANSEALLKIVLTSSLDMGAPLGFDGAELEPEDADFAEAASLELAVVYMDGCETSDATVNGREPLEEGGVAGSAFNGVG